GTVQLDGAASTLTDANGISLSTGTITGQRHGARVDTTNSAAQNVANGWTLEINGALTDSGSALALKVTGDADDLLLDGTSAAKSLSFNGIMFTLVLNPPASPILPYTTLFRSGTVQLDGAASTLTDANGISLSTGTIT